MGLLVAAHLKARASLSRAERLRLRDVAVLACALGYDALYERGYIAMGAKGRLLTAGPTGSQALDARLTALAGRQSEAQGPGRDPYLAEHRASCFLDTVEQC